MMKQGACHVMHCSYILFGFYCCGLEETNTSPANKVDQIGWVIENAAIKLEKGTAPCSSKYYGNNGSEVWLMFGFLSIHLVFLFKLVQMGLCLIMKLYGILLNRI